MNMAMAGGWESESYLESVIDSNLAPASATCKDVADKWRVGVRGWKAEHLLQSSRTPLSGMIQKHSSPHLQWHRGGWCFQVPEQNGAHKTRLLSCFQKRCGPTGCTPAPPITHFPRPCFGLWDQLRPALRLMLCVQTSSHGGPFCLLMSSLCSLVLNASISLIIFVIKMYLFMSFIHCAHYLYCEVFVLLVFIPLFLTGLHFSRCHFCPQISSLFVLCL